jgi:RNA polymerase sigma factor (sigma-70 family)
MYSGRNLSAGVRIRKGAARTTVTRNPKVRSEPRLAGSEAGLDQYAPGLYRYLARRVRRNQHIEDLVQYVYQRFLQSPGHELVRQPQAYLYRIAANVFNEWALHEGREIITYDSESLAEKADQSIDAFAAKDDLSDRVALEEQLQRILAQVPAKYRVVFLLSTRDGLTCREIAEQLHITPQTAKKYLSRALAYCRSADWNR